MADAVVFDHLAVGVEAWEDAYSRFVVQLGGEWSHGGDVGEFAPCQLIYGHDMRLEFIAPGGEPDGFMRRFLDRNGPGPHHLTFKVPSLADTLHRLEAEGVGTLGGRQEEYWKEVFLHPKALGVGTLIQIVEAGEMLLSGGFRTPPPEGFPTADRKALEIAWIGLTVTSLDTSRMLFRDHLSGRVVAEGAGWHLLSWGVGHNLLVREEGDAAPGGAGLWRAPGIGVDHVLFGDPALTPADLEGARVQAVRMPDDPAIGVAVFQAWQDCDVR